MLEKVFTEAVNDAERQAIVTAAYGWSIAKAGQGKNDDGMYVGPGGCGDQTR